MPSSMLIGRLGPMAFCLFVQTVVVQMETELEVFFAQFTLQFLFEAFQVQREAVHVSIVPSVLFSEFTFRADAA